MLAHAADAALQIAPVHPITRENEMKLCLSLALAISLVEGQKIDSSGVIESRSAAIRLRVVNESAVDRRSMALARKELTEILGRAGVSLIWLTCTSGWADWLSTDPCQRDRAPSEFWLRIVSRRPAGTSTSVLAFSELDENPGLRSAAVDCPAAVQSA